jgi:hypothetical protein
MPSKFLLVTKDGKWVVIYEKKNELVGLFCKGSFRSYGMELGFTLKGRNCCYQSGIGENDRFLIFHYANQHTCTKVKHGKCGSWMLYSSSGKLEARIGRFCPRPPCDERRKALKVNLFFDDIDSIQGTIVALFRDKLNSKLKHYIITYRFVKVGAQVKLTRLQTLLASPAIPENEKPIFHLKVFAIPRPEEIFVHLRMRHVVRETIRDNLLFILRKSKGFRKDEIFKGILPTELFSMGYRAFDNAMNRMLYLSPSSSSKRFVIKAISVNCTGNIYIARKKLKITYVIEFKMWKIFVTDTTGKVFIADRYSSANIYRIVPEI